MKEREKLGEALIEVVEEGDVKMEASSLALGHRRERKGETVETDARRKKRRREGVGGYIYL